MTFVGRRGGRTTALFPRIVAAGMLALIGVTCMTATANEQPWFPVLDHAAAWERLPKLTHGHRGTPLPIWARVLARPLPSTTAGMLEMDYRQRDGNPLDPRTRAKIRWVAARANGCKYTQAQARADLVRAGGDAEDLARIASSFRDLPPKEQRTLNFARKMCEAAYEVTDAEVAALQQDWGPKDLVAIVLTLAYSNFQDRLLNSLGIHEEQGAPLAALNIRFDWDDARKNPIKAPERVMPEPPADAGQVATHVDDPDWKAGLLEMLEDKKEDQQLRQPRIPIPPDEIVEKQTTPGMYPPGTAASIRWNGIGYGYQPELTEAWFSTMRRFRDDTVLPGDFRQTAFWVVTRSNWCFY